MYKYIYIDRPRSHSFRVVGCTLTRHRGNTFGLSLFFFFDTKWEVGESDSRYFVVVAVVGNLFVTVKDTRGV